MSQTDCVGFHSESFTELCDHEAPNGNCAFFKQFCDMKEETITISKERYESLLESEHWLSCYTVTLC